MSDENNGIVTTILQQPEDHKLHLEIVETDYKTGAYSIELEITWCRYKEQVAELQKRIADLESENKALRLIAGSHSMSELQRLQAQTGIEKRGNESQVASERNEFLREHFKGADGLDLDPKLMETDVWFKYPEAPRGEE